MILEMQLSWTNQPFQTTTVRRIRSTLVVPPPQHERLEFPRRSSLGETAAARRVVVTGLGVVAPNGGRAGFGRAESRPQTRPYPIRRSGRPGAQFPPLLDPPPTPPPPTHPPPHPTPPPP